MLHFIWQGQGAGRPDRAAQGGRTGQDRAGGHGRAGRGPSVRLSVCLAGQGRGQGRAGQGRGQMKSKR